MENQLCDGFVGTVRYVLRGLDEPLSVSGDVWACCALPCSTSGGLIHPRNRCKSYPRIEICHMYGHIVHRISHQHSQDLFISLHRRFIHVSTPWETFLTTGVAGLPRLHCCVKLKSQFSFTFVMDELHFRADDFIDKCRGLALMSYTTNQNRSYLPSSVGILFVSEIARIERICSPMFENPR
eukprot:827243-Amphidinium_carterae.1